MKLETTECISIENNGRKYTDCMEFSLLRFLQMLTYDPTCKVEDLEQIGKHVMMSYISDMYENLQLKEFLQEYPHIYTSRKRYHHLVKEGLAQRAAWAKLVSDRGSNLDYYRNDQAELFTSVENIIKFIRTFFPELDLDLDLNNNADAHSTQSECGDQQTIAPSIEYQSSEEAHLESEDYASYDEYEYDDYYDANEEYDGDYSEKKKALQAKLDNISNKFSQWINKSYTTDAIHRSISMKIKKVSREIRPLKMGSIFQMVSRPEATRIRDGDIIDDVDIDSIDEYYKKLQEEPNRVYEVIISHTELELKIDGVEYLWSLYEVYFDEKDRHLFHNHFITGHSIIHNIS
jgi:hypothetical protein